MIGAGVALLGATEAFAADLAPATARPEGWIGTTEQWTQGLGLALGLLNLVILVLAWRGLRRGGSVVAVGGMLIVGLTLLPLVVTFVGYLHGFHGMETVQSCGGCHVMTPYVNDLTDPQSVGAGRRPLQEPLHPGNPVLHLPQRLRDVRDGRREDGRRPARATTT